VDHTRHGHIDVARDQEADYDADLAREAIRREIMIRRRRSAGFGVFPILEPPHLDREPRAQPSSRPPCAQNIGQIQCGGRSKAGSSAVAQPSWAQRPAQISIARQRHPAVQPSSFLGHPPRGPSQPRAWRASKKTKHFARCRRAGQQTFGLCQKRRIFGRPGGVLVVDPNRRVQAFSKLSPETDLRFPRTPDEFSEAATRAWRQHSQPHRQRLNPHPFDLIQAHLV
jgi:hypothetical protein